ncbi:hypothetical protein [Clostridium sp.]|uniref:hypothetical protein n=1 Tax=Clostridium sp. TaxID=1506 RepID=UPI003D6D9E9B
MGIYKTFAIFIVVYLVMVLIFRYLIIIKKLEPNKLSRKFYDDDEIFIKSWKKTKAKGLLKHVLENSLIMIAWMAILSILFLLNENSIFGELRIQPFYTALLMGAILGIITSLMQWFLGIYRYNNLKQKGKV